MQTPTLPGFTAQVVLERDFTLKHKGNAHQRDDSQLVQSQAFNWGKCGFVGSLAAAAAAPFSPAAMAIAGAVGCLAGGLD